MQQTAEVRHGDVGGCGSVVVGPEESTTWKSESKGSTTRGLGDRTLLSISSCTCRRGNGFMMKFGASPNQMLAMGQR